MVAHENERRRPCQSDAIDLSGQTIDRVLHYTRAIPHASLTAPVRDLALARMVRS